MYTGKRHKHGWLPIIPTLTLILLLLTPGAAMAGDDYEKFTAELDFVIDSAAGVNFEQPTDLTIVDDRLYLMDGMNHRVAVFGLDGTFQRQFGNRREIPRAIGICADGEDGVYVTDAETGRLLNYSARGELRGSFTVSPVRERERPDITDCAVSEFDEIFLTDNNNHRIQVYSRDGEQLRHWGGFGEANHQFRFPATVTIDQDGVVFVVDVINNRVKGFRYSGRQAQWLGGWGITPGRLYRPKGALVVGQQVLVADSYTGVIQVFRTAGGFVGILTDQQGEILRFRTPTNMAFADNRLYVVEQLHNRVSVWRLEP